MNIKPGPNFLKFNDLPVDVEGEDPILPCNSFVELGLKQPIPYLLIENAYKQPTPIQCQVIPAIQAGRDALACSPTGSGKTVSSLILLSNISPGFDLFSGCVFNTNNR